MSAVDLSGDSRLYPVASAAPNKAVERTASRPSGSLGEGSVRSGWFSLAHFLRSVFAFMEKDKTPLAKLPEAWRTTAIGLKRSADIIWENWFEIFSRLEGGNVAKATPQEVGDVYLLLPSFLLLAGLALENALKGLLISNEPSIVDSIVKWEKIGLGGHDLGALFENNGLISTSDEKEFLDALTQAVLWSGRYPVPKHHGNESKIGIPLGPFLRNPDIRSIVSRMSELKNAFDSLYSQILREYPEPETEEPNKANSADREGAR